MNIFKMVFGPKETWTELETLYTAERMERIRSYLNAHRPRLSIRPSKKHIESLRCIKG